MTAVASNLIDYVQILIENNADTSVLAYEGSNLLGLAAFHKHFEIINFLLKYTDCDPHLKNNEGISAVN